MKLVVKPKKVLRVKKASSWRKDKPVRKKQRKQNAPVPGMIDKLELRRSILEDSFYDFVQYFWDTIVPEDPVWNWHIEYICNELQTMAERVFKGQEKEYDLIINVPPGSSKSTICTILFPMWTWTRLRSTRTICGSYAYPLALELSRKSRLVLKSEKYQELWPDIELAPDQDTKGYFANTHGGGRYCVGTGGTVTGFHAHFIIIDDPINPKEALSEPGIKEANLWMRETIPTRKVDKAVTPTILIMQRLAQADPTGDWLERTKDGMVKHICLPAELDDNVSPPECRKFYKDGLLDPVRLTRKVLLQNLVDLGEFGYAGQFQQRPVPRGGGMFKTGRFVLEDGAPHPKRFVQRVRFWDKAGTPQGGAYTVGTLMGLDRKKRFWVLDVVRGQWDSGEREEIIKQTAEMDTKKVIVAIEQEPGSGGKESAQNTVKNLAGWRVRVDRPTGDKVARADPFSVQVNIGNVHVVKGEWTNTWMDEHMYFPNSRYKDQVDSASGAFAQLTSRKKRIGGLKLKGDE